MFVFIVKERKCVYFSCIKHHFSNNMYYFNCGNSLNFTLMQVEHI